MNNEDDFLSFLEKGGLQSTDKKNLPSIITSDLRDGVDTVVEQLIKDAYNDYQAISDQIQSGTSDPKAMDAAANLLSSIQSLVDLITKRDLQKKRIQHDIWKVERNIEGRKEINAEKASIATAKLGNGNTFIQNNETKIIATREEALKMLVNIEDEDTDEIREVAGEVVEMER